MKMEKFEQDISAFREELINKKTSFLNIGIPKLNLKDREFLKPQDYQHEPSITDRGVLAPPQIMKT